MPRPSNELDALKEVLHELLYEKKKDLKDCNWNIQRSANKIVLCTNWASAKYGRLTYILACEDNIQNVWLKITQTDKAMGLDKSELLNIPICWLPAYWLDEIQELITACLFKAPQIRKGWVDPSTAQKPAEEQEYVQ
jgi:hypothetical protein